MIKVGQRFDEDLAIGFLVARIDSFRRRGSVFGR